MTSEISPDLKPTVLIVDDEALIRWSLRDRLVRAGFRVLEAADGQTALSQLGNGGGTVDLMLLDLRLPDSDGLSLLKSAKSKAPDCPVILMSAYGTEDVQREALATGAVFFVQKPFKIDDVLGLVRRTLAFHS
ncbi:MAG: response regulator [Planctomycetes bacterium]|nr:response regulator [Planctomycetota bacterium]